MTEELLDLDAVAISQKIQSGKITIEKITSILIDHIKRVNGSLNAVVEERFNLALEEAKEKDRLVDQVDFNKQPLYGVPISIKESFNVKGMKTTGGIVHRKDLIMSKDATIVKRLKDAGAIILAKTNTPSLNFCQETDNKLYGRTNNAWNKRKTAGGSSGGEGALIAVGGSPVGISSDIGGSIRLPSHFNGVTGFKAGMEQIPAEGYFPQVTNSLQQRMSTFGPIGKSVRDCEIVYQVIKNKEKNKHRGLYKKIDIDILPVDNGFPLSKAIANKLIEIMDFLKPKYDSQWAIPPHFNDSAQLWQEIMSIDGAKDFKKLAFNTDRVNIWKKYSMEKLFRRTNTHHYLSWALIGAHMFKPSTKRVKEVENTIKTGDKIIERHFNNRILIMPVYHRSALKHGELFKEIFSINKSFLQYLPYITYANVWGLPSLTIPVGFDNKNLPFAIQLISANGNEASLFTIGKKIEAEFGGYKRSTLYDV